MTPEEVASEIDALHLDDIDWNSYDLTPEEVAEVTGHPELEDPFAAADIALLHGSPMYPDPENAKAYVVYRGRRPGVYQTWDGCAQQVERFSNAVYKGYKTVANARAAWEQSKANGTNQPPPPSPAPPSFSSRLRPGRGPPFQPPRHQPTVTHSQPSSHYVKKEPLSQVRFNESPASTQPLPSTSTFMLPSDIPAPRQLTSDDFWYVVVVGIRPGVYKGRLTAESCVGQYGPRVVYKWPTQAQANSFFVLMYSLSRVAHLSPSGRYICEENMATSSSWFNCCVTDYWFTKSDSGGSGILGAFWHRDLFFLNAHVAQTFEYQPCEDTELLEKRREASRKSSKKYYWKRHTGKGSSWKEWTLSAKEDKMSKRIRAFRATPGGKPTVKQKTLSSVWRVSATSGHQSHAKMQLPVLENRERQKKRRHRRLIQMHSRRQLQLKRTPSPLPPSSDLPELPRTPSPRSPRPRFRRLAEAPSSDLSTSSSPGNLPILTPSPRPRVLRLPQLPPVGVAIPMRTRQILGRLSDEQRSFLNTVKWEAMEKCDNAGGRLTWAKAWDSAYEEQEELWDARNTYSVAYNM
ncbi:hypothetical protein DFP72DRAFT_850163 [Ephemerocybe angulata]|uniref:Ribonuclease H1 N-terminal domain-containing protein n=1 Tax=Ephemerocybe angulata TaxID=980116 RepID=A0A8H6HSH1_9AGAR|nr:hypothetical protein DFP72DRAFT_850163 [Tulosesus angulatus]